MPAQPSKIGKYEVLAEIGRGAMGTVYKARDPVLDRMVAIKTMSEDLLIEQEMRDRFDREARSAANLQHPNIVTVFDFGKMEQGVPFIVMELLNGVSLAELIEEGKPERLEEKIHILTQICRGLDYAHKEGVIHRDVKPGNIQVLPNGTAKILDFGIAMGEGSTIKTKTGLVMGTPNYMAPEQIADQLVDHRADMWAVGVILFELLTGQRPFAADTVPSLVYRIVHSSPPRLDVRRLGLPPKLGMVVERVLMKSPDKRFRDLAQMATALERVTGAPTSGDEMSSQARARSYTSNLELAKNLLGNGQPARALEAARRAQALEPSHASVVDLIQEIEVALTRMATEPTYVGKPAPHPEFEASRWIDEARMALTAGNPAEASRIVESVLAVEPGFAPALELQELLARPERPGRTGLTGPTGRMRSATFRPSSRLTSLPVFAETVTFGEPPGVQILRVGTEPQLIAVGGLDGSVRLWDLAHRRKLASFQTDLHQRAGVTSLAFSSDGTLLASGHVDGAIHLWSLDTGQEMKLRMRHDASVGELAFSPDCETLASGGLDSTLKLWELARVREGEAMRRLIRQPAGVTSLVYSQDGAILVTGHTNRTLRVHDVASGRLTATLRGHEAPVSTMVLSPDGNHVATGGQDRTIRIFDLNRRQELIAMAGHKKAVGSLCYFPDGSELASVAMDTSLIIWDLEAGAPRTTLWGAAGDTFASVQVVGEEPLIVAGLSDGSIRVWAPK